MTELVLTEEQAALIRSQAEGVVLRDPQGNIVGRVTQPEAWRVEDEDEIIESIRQNQKRPQRTYTTEEVLAKLRALESTP